MRVRQTFQSGIDEVARAGRGASGELDKKVA